ncbi:kinase-like domain-containing protein [Mycena vulgaris]|nr:kinase-like domain-containing protein [Mycena vulgaris]
MHSEPQILEKTKARNWWRLDHPNILRFLGIALDLGRSPALISPLCASGPIMKYIQQNSEGLTEKLQMAIGVANGLAYLHAEGIVHGNLCRKKVLVNGEGVPVICFSVDTSISSVRTTFGDVYSLSMVTLEILSGLEPYHHLTTEHAVFMYILRGDRPIRTDLDPQIVTNRIWRLLVTLWNQNPSLRPTMAEVISSLIRIRDDESTTNEISAPTDPSSPRNENGDEISSGEESSLAMSPEPTTHTRNLKDRVKQDDPYPFASGGNSNIYRGKLTRSDGRKIRVAIKMIRVFDDGTGQLEDVTRRLRREVEVWSRLKHKNILPFIGACDDLAPTPVLISPFYKFGHVATYLRKHPEINRRDLVLGIASGFEFLHASDIIHGDLKVQNVLVNKRGIPCICDFGVSKIINRRGFTMSNFGTAPYMAPELCFVIDGGIREESPSTTKSSDVYSFGLLVLEILISEPPKGRPSKTIVTTKILAELRPKRVDYEVHKVNNETWSVLDRCWSFEPQLRRPISSVQDELITSL